MNGSCTRPLAAPAGCGVSEGQPSPVLLGLERVSLARQGRLILGDLDLDIRRGSITAIVGPSGAGKSTLLAALNGLLPPIAGSLRVDGIGPLQTPASLLAHRRRSATVFQEHALIARLPALDNVLLGLAERRHPLSLLPWSRRLRGQAIDALAEVGLLDKALEPVARLSGGERQRVAIARALVRRPHLLLADEPFAALDPALAGHLASEFRRLVREHALTLVIVLHQLDLARRIADRVVGLGGGGILFNGEAKHFDAQARQRVFPELHPTPGMTRLF